MQIRTENINAMFWYIPILVAEIETGTPKIL